MSREDIFERSITRRERLWADIRSEGTGDCGCADPRWVCTHTVTAHADHPDGGGFPAPPHNVCAPFWFSGHCECASCDDAFHQAPPVRDTGRVPLIGCFLDTDLARKARQVVDVIVPRRFCPLFFLLGVCPEPACPYVHVLHEMYSGDVPWLRPPPDGPGGRLLFPGLCHAFTSSEVTFRCRQQPCPWYHISKKTMTNCAFIVMATGRTDPSASDPQPRMVPFVPPVPDGRCPHEWAFGRCPPPHLPAASREGWQCPHSHQQAGSPSGELKLFLMDAIAGTGLAMLTGTEGTVPAATGGETSVLPSIERLWRGYFHRMRSLKQGGEKPLPENFCVPSMPALPDICLAFWFSGQCPNPANCNLHHLKQGSALFGMASPNRDTSELQNRFIRACPHCVCPMFYSCGICHAACDGYHLHCRNFKTPGVASLSALGTLLTSPVHHSSFDSNPYRFAFQTPPPNVCYRHWGGGVCDDDTCPWVHLSPAQFFTMLYYYMASILFLEITVATKPIGSAFGSRPADTVEVDFVSIPVETFASAFATTSDTAGSAFGSRPADTAGSAFGLRPADTAGSAFGSRPAGTAGSAFGSRPADTAGSAFGSRPADTAGSAFGLRPADTARSAFGLRPADTAGSAFGSRPAGTAGSAFGSRPADTAGSAFGSRPADTAGSAFGLRPADTARSAFGLRPADTAGSAFGLRPADTAGSAFGPRPADTAGSAFGSRLADTRGASAFPSSTVNNSEVNFVSRPVETFTSAFATRTNDTTGSARVAPRAVSPPRDSRVPSRLSNVNYEAEVDGADNECSICLVDLVEGEPVLLVDECGHVFHRDCLAAWRRSQQDPTCPVCRQPIRRKR